jgi:hypothetical protein
MKTYNTNTIINNPELNDYFDQFYLSEYLDKDTEITHDELVDILQVAIGKQEIIYYSDAMDYLKKNDPSLQLSLELARDICVPVEKLKSILLATLLLRDHLYDLIDPFIYDYTNEVM